MKNSLSLALHGCHPKPLKNQLCGLERYELECCGLELCGSELSSVERQQSVNRQPCGKRRLSVKHLLCLFLLVLSATGCGRRNQDYVPTATNARQALELALRNWKNGTKPGEPMQSKDNRAMVVELFDGDYSSGAQLIEWRIESEGSATSGPKQFQVVIQIANKAGAVSSAGAAAAAGSAAAAAGSAAAPTAAATDGANVSPLEQKVTYYVTGMSGRFAVFRDKEYELRSSQM